VIAVFALMFALGKLLLGEWPIGVGLAVVGVATGWAMLKWVFGRSGGGSE
jgi:hypothetical protein